MKRLIRKAEFVDAFEHNGNYIEIFKNPTGRELSEIEKVEKNIRAFIHLDGTVYVWPARILHNVVENKYPEIASDIRLEKSTSRNLIYLCEGITDVKQVIDAFNKCNFSQLGLSNNSNITFDPDYYGCEASGIEKINGYTIKRIMEMTDEDLNNEDKIDNFDKLIDSLKERGMTEVNKNIVTDNNGFFVYYDNSQECVYTCGPFFKAQRFNDVSDTEYIWMDCNTNWSYYAKNKLDPNIDVEFNNKQFFINFTNKKGYDGLITQDIEGNMTLVSLIDKNGNDISQKFLNQYPDGIDVHNLENLGNYSS